MKLKWFKFILKTFSNFIYQIMNIAPIKSWSYPAAFEPRHIQQVFYQTV